MNGRRGPVYRAPKIVSTELVVEIDMDEEISAETVKERLLGTFRSPAYRPPVLPTVALELLALSKNLDVQLRHILELLEKDTLIAGEVLKLAQSASYQRGGGVRTLEQAVTRLGLRTLSDLCLHASLKARVFRAPGYEQAMNEVRRHSALTAQLCRLASAYVSFPDDYAYTCGLMHDIGVAGCLTVLGDVPRGGERPPLDDVMPAIRDVHQEAGGILAGLWRFPEDVKFVIAKHHEPITNGKTHPLIAAIVIAEGVAKEFGLLGVCEFQAQKLEHASRLLRFPADGLARLRKAAETIVTELE